MVSPWEDSRSWDLRLEIMDALTRAKEMTNEEVASALLRLERLEARAQNDQALIRWLQHQVFGPKSEKRLLDELCPEDQLWLGEQMLEHSENPPPEEETVRSYERKQRSDKNINLSKECESSRLKFDDSVPVQEIQVEDPELAKRDLEQVEFIGEKIIHRLAQRSSYVVLKYVRKIWRDKGVEEVHKAKAPAGIIDRSFADVSFLAELAIEKCCFHLPLYRQHQRLQQSGVHIKRSTLTRLLQRVAELMEPIYGAQMSSLLQSQVIAMDESPTPAGRGNGKMKKGYYWALYGDRDEVCFLYSPSRAKAVIDSVLGNFEGTLLSDGYRAYELFAEKKPGVALAGCWAHTRRYFLKAEQVEPDKAKWVLRKFQQLYEVEAKARGKPKKLKVSRDKESRPIVDALFEYFKTELERTALLPSNPFVKAVEYAMKREPALRVFLENPEVPIDTNHLERMIRPAVVGRKNWLFHTTEEGARHAGMLYSLLQTCRLHDINPRTYLIDVLQRIETHPAAEAYLLTPVNWKENFSASPLASDVDKKSL